MSSRKRSNKVVEREVVADDVSVSSPKRQRRGDLEDNNMIAAPASQCAQWKQHRSSEQIASVRAVVRKVIEAFLGKAGERDWKQLISRVMTTYDQQALNGKLAKMLDQQGIRIHVRVDDETITKEEEERDVGRVYSLHFDIRAMKNMEKAAAAGGRFMNGIQCKDVIELLQVSIESQIARLITDTVCRSSGAAAAESDPALCREFASSLFGHTFPVILSRLAVLPEALLWMVSNSLSKREAVVLGQTNKQLRDDLSKPVHGLKVLEYVDIKAVLDPSRGWARRKGLIGNFTAFYVSTLDELIHLPRGTLQLKLNLPERSIVTSAMLSRLSLMTHLDFGDKFNQPVEDFELPASLTHLKFGTYFKRPVKELKLPTSLTHLEFSGKKFNQPIDGLKLPDSLTYLKLGWGFNQPIEGIELLTSLTYLQIGGDKSIENLTLPTSLTHLVISGHEALNQSIEHLILPNSLTHLEFACRLNQSIEKLKLPASLTHLTFDAYVKESIENLKLPASLTHLDLGGHFEQPIDNLKLPASLTHLTFGYALRQPIENLKLPASLTHLIIDHNFGQPIENLKLPASLTHLDFGGYQPSANLKLPASLTHLKFYNYEPIQNLTLPASLTHLTFGAPNNDIEALHLPDWLTHLKFDLYFDDPIDLIKLPASLTHLTFVYHFKGFIEKLKLPASLTHLYFGRGFEQSEIEEYKLLLPPRLVIQIDRD